MTVQLDVTPKPPAPPVWPDRLAKACILLGAALVVVAVAMLTNPFLAMLVAGVALVAVGLEELIT
jgi:hypothetical protein